jgi:hypothetical protein
VGTDGAVVAVVSTTGGAVVGSADVDGTSVVVVVVVDSVTVVEGSAVVVVVASVMAVVVDSVTVVKESVVVTPGNGGKVAKVQAVVLPVIRNQIKLLSAIHLTKDEIKNIDLVFDKCRNLHRNANLASKLSDQR